MKKLFIILSLFMTTQSFALTKIPIPVVGLSTTDMGSMFNLETGLTPLKVVLDCQSFLHGINIYQQDSEGTYIKAIEFYLYQPECQEIYNFVKSRTDQNLNSCIVLDTDSKSYDLFESCEEAGENYSSI